MMPAKTVLEQISRVPGLRKKAQEIAGSLAPGLDDRDALDAAAASAGEFILEGLHVHNKLNKAAKPGGTTYRR
jgi:magnesium chelatase subunit I